MIFDNLNREKLIVSVHTASFLPSEDKKCKAWLSEVSSPRLITRVIRASGCNVRIASVAAAIISD